MKNKSITSLSLRKVLLSALVAAPMATLPAPLWALPQTASTNVTSSSATTTFQTVGTNLLNITDTSANRLVLKWNQFGSGSSPIAAGETIIWSLPSTSSAVLNMVSTGATLVEGTLQSNGSIFILNPNGITLSNTAVVNAAGFGVSTIPEAEFFFLANGNLSYVGTPTADVVVNTAASGINVGSSGNVFVAGRSADVTGVINAGMLTVTSSTGGTGVRLAQSGALTVGTAATSTTAGNGSLTVNSGGAAVSLSGAGNTTTVRGNATITTGGGAVTQGAGGSFVLGDTQANSTLTINSGTGAVTLTNISAPNATGVSGRRVAVALTSGVTNINATSRIQLNAGTVTGTGTGTALTVTGTHNIDSGGEVTVTGGSIALSTSGTDRVVAFRGPGDLTFSTLVSSGGPDNEINVTSTTGSVTLPTITTTGSLTVTAQTNIAQTGALSVDGTDKQASFDAVTGSITLTNTANDFKRLQIKNAPSGALVVDADDVILASGTNATGNVTITAGSIQLGQASGSTIVVAGNLNLFATTAGTASATIVAGGTGFTSAPTVSGPGGATGTTTLGVNAISGPSTAGSGYATAPSVTLTGGGGSGVTTSTTLVINGTTGSTITPGSGYTTRPTVGFTAAPAGGTTPVATATLTIPNQTVTLTGSDTNFASAPNITFSAPPAGGTAPVATAIFNGGTGQVTGYTITTPGTGYTTIPTVTITNTSPGGTVTAPERPPGVLGSIVFGTAGSGYATAPTVTIDNTGTNGTGGAIVVTGGVGGVTVTAPGTGFTALPSVTFAAPTTGTSATGSTATGQIATVTITNAGSLTSTATALTIVGGGGTGASATASVTGGTGVTDAANSVAVNGNLNITSAGPVIIDGATGNGVGLAHRFGQVNVTQTGNGGITIYESTTLNLGTITTSAALRAYSSAGDVINTGPLTIAGLAVGAGTGAAPGNITINNASNLITGSIALLDDFAVLSNGPANGGTVNTYLANNVTIVNNTNTTLAPIVTTAGNGINGTLNVTATAAGSDITLSGVTNVAGAVTLNAADAITATASNTIANATIIAGGNVDFRAGRSLTINATLTQNAAGNTASFTAAGLALANINSDYTGTVRFQSTGGNDVTDTVAGVRVFGPVHFQSARGITINDPGHSFGRVSAATSANNGSITIVESGGLRLGTVTTNGTGSFTATSTTGDILQDTTQSGIVLGNTSTGTATFTATAGSITLDDSDNRMARINATAAGNIVIVNPMATTLGNVTAGGTLTVTSGNGFSISQLSGSRLNVFGTTMLVSGTTGDITIGNTGNRMGGVVASTGSGNITITENTTLNLKSIQTTGNFSATSEAGSVIDSTDATITYPAGSINAVRAGGTVAFSAPTGNVTLGLAGSTYGVVGFTTGGNVSILDSVGDIVLGTSTIGGTLDVVLTGAGGVIRQSGIVKVSGGTTLTTNAGGIDLSNASNEFGGIRFTVGAPGAIIAENTTLNLRGGSVSTGPVQLSTNANFVTSGAGGSSITNNLTISAQGTIIPGAGSLLVTGVFTVFSPSTKDLSALSKSGNLTGRDPVNLGAGTYIPPGP